MNGPEYKVGQITGDPKGQAIILFYAVSETRGFPIQIIGNTYVSTPTKTYQFGGYTVDELLSCLKILPEECEEITSVGL